MRARDRIELVARRNQFGELVVNLDQSLETLRSIPGQVIVAVPDPVTGAIREETVEHLRHDLCRTRETARQALLRCERELGEAP